MLFSKLFHFKKNYVGITMSDKAIHAAKLCRQSNQFSLINTISLALDASSPAKLKQPLSLLQQTCCQKSRNIIFGMPLHETLTYDLYLDKQLSADEIMQYLNNNATRLFSMPNQSLYIDYYQIPHADQNKQFIRSVAAPRDKTDHLIQTFQQANITLSAIDLDIHGDCNAINHLLNDPHNDNTTALLKMHTQTMTLGVLHQQALIYCHQEPSYSNIIATAHRLIQYYHCSNRQQAIQKIILIGELNHCQHLAYHLSKTLGLPCQIATNGVSQQLNQPLSPELITAYGLALGSPV